MNYPHNVDLLCQTGKYSAIQFSSLVAAVQCSASAHFAHDGFKWYQRNPTWQTHSATCIIGMRFGMVSVSPTTFIVWTECPSHRLSFHGLKIHPRDFFMD